MSCLTYLSQFIYIGIYQLDSQKNQENDFLADPKISPKLSCLRTDKAKCSYLTVYPYQCTDDIYNQTYTRLSPRGF